MKKLGFTLAETLITLAIIGVVAALTVPTLMKNYQKKELETGLKKGATTIANALAAYKAANGEPITSKAQPQTAKDLLVPYFKSSRDCKNLYSKGCISPGIFEKMYSNYNSDAAPEWWYFDDGQIHLSDGTYLFFDNAHNAMAISIDVNGAKKPNKLGHDLFLFDIDEDGKFLPTGAKGARFYSTTNEYCSKTSQKQSNGIGCTYRALYDPTFWKEL